MSINNEAAGNQSGFSPNDGYRFLYVRDRKGTPVGVIASTTSGHMGWSLCKRNYDYFDRLEAKNIATAPTRLRRVPSVDLLIRLLNVRNTPMNRALCALSQDTSVPHTIRKAAREALQTRQTIKVSLY